MKKSTTDVGVLAVSWVARNPAISETSLVRPFVCTFGLPCPLNPPFPPFIRDCLGLPVLAEERLVSITECRGRSSLAVTTANSDRTRECSVVSRTYSSTIEIFSTVSCSRSPFANYCPKVEISKRLSLTASGLYVFLIRQLVFLHECTSE